MLNDWIKQAERLERIKYYNRIKNVAKWSDLKEKVKNWKTNHRNNRTYIYKSHHFLSQKMGSHTESLIFWDSFFVLRIYEETQMSCEYYVLEKTRNQ